MFQGCTDQKKGNIMSTWTKNAYPENSRKDGFFWFCTKNRETGEVCINPILVHFAMKNAYGQFRPMYQPVVDSGDGSWEFAYPEMNDFYLIEVPTPTEPTT